MSGPPESRLHPAGLHEWLTRRRVAALVQAAIVLLLPFVRIGGESALRFDLPALTLYAFGTAMGVDALFAVLAGIVLVVVLVAGSTVILGRTWFGRSCPQALLPALADWAASALPARARRPARILVLVLLSAAVSFALMGYFLPPAAAAAGIALAASIALGPPLEFAVQWEESVRGSDAQRYGYAVRNNTGDPLALSLDAEGGAELIGDRRIAVPPRARVTGKALVRPGGRDGDGVAFVVTGPGISLRKKAAAP